MLRQGARAAFVTWSLEKPTQGLKIKNYLSETRAHFLNICYLSTTLQALKVQTHELLGDTNKIQTTERSHAEIKNLHSISCPMSRSPVPAGCWQQGGRWCPHDSFSFDTCRLSSRHLRNSSGRKTWPQVLRHLGGGGGSAWELAPPSPRNRWAEDCSRSHQRQLLCASWIKSSINRL